MSLYTVTKVNFHMYLQANVRSPPQLMHKGGSTCTLTVGDVIPVGIHTP